MEAKREKFAVVFDGRESNEPGVYLIPTSRAPKHMRRMLRQNKKNEKRVYEHIYEADGAESCDGLVDNDHKMAEERAGEVWAFLDGSCVPQNRLCPPTRCNIQYSISLLAV